MAGLVFLLVFWALAGAALPKAQRGRVFIVQFFFFYIRLARHTKFFTSAVRKANAVTRRHPKRILYQKIAVFAFEKAKHDFLMGRGVSELPQEESISAWREIGAAFAASGPPSSSFSGLGRLRSRLGRFLKTTPRWESSPTSNHERKAP